MRHIQLIQTDPKEMQNLLIRKYRIQFFSFFILSVLIILFASMLSSGSHWVEIWESFSSSDAPIGKSMYAFFSFVGFVISAVIFVVALFIYAEKSVFVSEKEDAQSSLENNLAILEKRQIKLANLLLQIAVLEKDLISVENLHAQADSFRKDISVCEKQIQRLEQCIADLDRCTVNSFRKYCICVFIGLT